MNASESSKTIIRGTGITSVLTLVSRILGFIRDLLVAQAFGAGFFADAYVVAFRIPNLLRSLVGEGALTAAFVPVFAGELTKGPNQARSAIRSVSGFLLIVTGLLTLTGIGFSRTIVSLFAPGFASDPAKLELCTQLTQIMFPYIICVSFVAMLNGALNAVNIFGAAAFAQVVMNIFLIIGALLADLTTERTGVVILSVSVVVGGIAQVVAQLPALKRSGLTIMPIFSLGNRIIRDLLSLMLPATIGAAIYQTTIFLNTILASFLVAGSVSWLFYADRLTQLPIGIFTIALASVLLPVLSKAQASNDHSSFTKNLENSLRYTSFILIPICAGIYVLAQPLITIMFQRGAFDANATEMTALAVQGLCIGIWASSCQSMLSRAFIAKKDTVTPTVLGFMVLILNCWFGLSLMGTLPEGEHGAIHAILRSLQLQIVPEFMRHNFGHVGLSLATSLSSCIALAIYAVLIGRRMKDLEFGSFTLATLKGLIASIAMCFTFIGLGLNVGSSTSQHLVHIAIAGVIGPPIYVAIYFCCRGGTEAKETFALIFRLLRRGQSNSGSNSGPIHR